MKKNWAFRKDAEAVSPVIATILMVAITVVLAAVLYVMVLGFGGDASIAPTLSISKEVASNGYKFKPTSPTEDVAWTDVIIQLTTPTAAAGWSNMTTADLTDTTPPGVWHYGSSTSVGGVMVWLNITDIGGNGYINSGDYFVVTYSGATGWTAGTIYTVTMVYDPSDEEMGHTTFP
jgi:flagellin-like protein